jgi:hypothetical protein
MVEENFDPMPELSRRAVLGLIAASAGAASTGVSPVPATLSSPNILPFDIDLRRLNASPRKVYAHWHVFPISFDNQPADHDQYTSAYMNPNADLPFGEQAMEFGGYQRERPLPRPPRAGADWITADMVQDVRRAARIGIDGFIFNIVTIDSNAQLWRNLLHMLDAVNRLETVFKIIPSIDCAANSANDPIDEMVYAIRSIASHPATMHTQDNRLVLGSFMPEAWPVERWQLLFEALLRSNIKVSFFGVFLNFWNAGREHLALTDIASMWGGADLGEIPKMLLSRLRARAMGCQWGMPVWTQDFRPKNGWYREAANSEVFRESWRLAIDTSSDCVHMVTWNDYSEGSEIQPSTGIQYSFYDLAAYYISWYKIGKSPQILRDVLYYFHRIEPTDGQNVGALQGRKFELRFGQPPVNDIELVGFLTDSGRLEIEIDGVVVGVNALAGVTSLRAPLGPGRPVFRLVRSGRNVISFQSAFEIRYSSSYQDLLYRGGSSSRRPVFEVIGPP